MTMPVNGPNFGMQGGPVVNFDQPHGDFPLHADMIAPTDFGSHKIRVDTSGNILSDDLVFSNRFQRDNG